MDKSQKCVKCSISVKYMGSRKKVIRTDEEIQYFSKLLPKPIKTGDIICEKCRLSMRYLSKAVKTEPESEIDLTMTMDEQDTNTTPFTSHKESTSKKSGFNEDRDKTEEREVMQKFDEINPTDSDCTSNEPLSQISSGSDPSYHTPTPRTVTAVEENIEMPYPRPVSTHKYCFLCNDSSSTLKVVPLEARIHAFVQCKVYIPPQNRLCEKHLIKRHLYIDDLKSLRISARSSQMSVSELTLFMNTLSLKADNTLLDRICDFSLSEEHIHALTGYSWQNIMEIRSLLQSMRKSHTRTVTQALVTFLIKLRTGNSNNVIASILGITREQTVSDYFDAVQKSFEREILPSQFGVRATTRDELIQNHTAPAMSKLFGINGKLVIICDGTYIRHEKSANNIYQRKSYSGQKKVPLCKPFTICATDGFIIDVPGPFYGNENDATILRKVLADKDGISRILQKGDIFILDRGFRDIVSHLEDLGFEVLMPSLKGKRKQLTWQESNQSRFVTKIRWVVEAAHGIIGRKFQLIHNQLDNKMLHRVKPVVQIACFLYNKFAKRLSSDYELQDEIFQRMKDRQSYSNRLAVQKEEGRWERRKSLFTSLSSTELNDFPELDRKDLQIFFTGTYQLQQAVSYLAELVSHSELSAIPVYVYKEDDGEADMKLIKVEVRSRHINQKKYRLFIKYQSNKNTVDGILDYSCECANGNRTVGSCSHVAAVIYFLSHGKYQSKILRPNDILTNLFEPDLPSSEVTIEEDSDED